MARRILITLGLTVAALNLLALLALSGLLLARPATAADDPTKTTATPVALTVADLSAQTGRVVDQISASNKQLTALNTSSDKQLTVLNSTTNKQLTALTSIETRLTTLNSTTDKQLTVLNSTTDKQLTVLNSTTDKQLTTLTSIETRLKMRTVSAIAEAEVKGQPDIGTAQIDVKTQAPALEVALAQNKAQVADLRGKIKALGIADDALNAADPDVAPLLDDKRTITGYRVLTPLLAQVKDPNGAGGKTLEAIVKLGGSGFKEVKFSTSAAQKQLLALQARTAAFKQAQERAAAYAKLGGGTLGQVQEISEDLNIRRQTTPPLPGVPTEQVFTAEVRVTFELK